LVLALPEDAVATFVVRVLHLPIEEKDEGRWCLWRPDHAGFDSRSIFERALVEE
jgi:hypothetical protein